MTYILAIDQGTTSSRAILFDQDLKPQAQAQQEFGQIFPKSGWVEHDPEEIWQSTLDVCTEVGLDQVAAIGITNQRETTVIWDRHTGHAIFNAIVWQDRRTGEYCDSLRDEWQEKIADKTGLLLDSYFSATKVNWILDHVEGARTRADAGDLLFGTIDSFLIWRMTGGASHVTDATNAARTMLYNIHDGCWDNALLELFGIPESMMPQVLDSAADFGTTTIFDRPIPITGVAGDQQAATVGQACFRPGMMKSTYGTGCFALMNTGDTPVKSNNRLLTTIAYQLNGKPTYALEGSIFIAGAVVQWLRDGIQIIENAAETTDMALAANPEEQVYFIPAFTGLGAPYWRADVRGALFGLTRNTGRAEIAKAALESVAFQTRDLWDAMQKDGATSASVRVDGGMANSDWTMQNLADILGVDVDRPTVTETTAMGAAYLAGLFIGHYPEPDEFAKSWALDRRFSPEMPASDAAARVAGWNDAIARLTN
ncbi:glycerol kinase [Amylibacter marinus]|uniref:Glycerol kinase n=1 Tax=Amylibacter marinus TaxID=1475483 RepID=A0ABQ5VWP3_9RHOB|nr:glycerol kinase GlpK [Amylibacter marinus]GLQ35612.1 glycerol kinase [Amylibacter marinus]